MKKHTGILMGVALLACSTGAIAQKATKHQKDVVATVKPIPPPAPVDSAFQAKFSGSTATWMKTPAGNFCATIDNNGQKEYIEYSPDGQWIRNRTDVATNQLPDSAKNALQTQYPGMEIAAVQKLEYDSVNPFYKVDLKQGDQSKSVMVNDAGYIQE